MIQGVPKELGFRKRETQSKKDMHQRKLFGAAGEENKKMCVDGATQATTVYIKCFISCA